MRVLISIALLIFSQVTFAQNNVINADLIESHYASKNFVWNSGAEKNKNLITESASITTRSTSTPLEGSASFAIDGTADDQTVCFNSKTIDSVYKNKNFQAQFYFSGDASLYKAYVKIGSDKITSDVTLTNETVSKEVNFNFPSGDLSTSPVVCIETTAAGAAAIKVDKVYLGPAFNLQNVSQAEIYGTLNYASTAACDWPFTTTTPIADIPADTDCPSANVTGRASAPGTKVPAITFASLPAGIYEISVNAEQLYCASASDCYFRLTDGTNHGTMIVANSVNAQRPNSLSMLVTYDSDQTGVTFKIQAAQGSAGTSYIINGLGSNSKGLLFTVKRFPTSSQLAINSNEGPFFTDEVAYTPTFTGFGTVSSVNFVSSRVGDKLYIRGSFVTGTTTATGGRITLGYNGTNSNVTISTTKAPTTQICGSMVFDQTSAVYLNTVICNGGNGYVGIASQSSSGNGLAEASVSSFTSTGQKHSIFAIVPIQGWTAPSTDAPILVGSVTSNSSGAERTCRFSFGGASDPSACTSTPCTLYRSDSCVSSVTRAATGDYTVNFNSNLFSAAPVCITQAIAADTNRLILPQSVSSSAYRAIYRTLADADVDIPVQGICMGPR